MNLDQAFLTTSATKNILEKGVQVVAPLWSLENFVAVNPYMGLTDKKFADAMGFLHLTNSTQATLPKSFYLKAIQDGKLKKEDIAQALSKNNLEIESDVDEFIHWVMREDRNITQENFTTVGDLASRTNGKKWGRFMIDRISFWAASYFDQNQASWKTSFQSDAIFKAWKKEAESDRSADLMGLKGFRSYVSKLPNNYLIASRDALERLQVPEETLIPYLTSLLMKMNGWAGIAARMDWDKKLVGEVSNNAEEFLAIMLVWEVALLELLPYRDFENAWEVTKISNSTLAENGEAAHQIAHFIILQEAFDVAEQRAIIKKLNAHEPRKTQVTPKAQAIFCIDVRSEVFRRNLEAVDNSIETLGFAGFFAFPVKYQSLAHEDGVDQCPVLLNTSHSIHESLGSIERDRKAIAKRRFKKHVTKAWKSFKKGAVSCFGFVSPLGIYFLPKLLLDSFGITRPSTHPDKFGITRQNMLYKGVNLDSTSSGIAGIPEEDRIQMAKSALKAMSLTENFAETVLIVGHGSATTNNPHGTGLDCGACGGHTGEANARVAANVLNDMVVRENLKNEGIDIPDTTLFVPALHNTTTDEVTMFTNGMMLSSHTSNLLDLKYALELAGESARKERSKRMNISPEKASKAILHRSKDWSQVRPEWGLAGCSSFIVAPRERTLNLDLEGKAFMHNYSWEKDIDFSILELIMTAPMVVTSWINLQYYASTVDNKRFGAGNKTLHNVVGGIGVLEGFGGDLRTGLPMQSIHDGDSFQHEPHRLNVIIEAPVDVMSKILSKHENVKQLCDNQWIYLFALNKEGKVAYKYIGDLQWEVV